MPRSSDSLIAPRLSAPDLPETLGTASPRRGADLHAVALELQGEVDLAHATLEQCRVAADAQTVDLTGATLLDVEVRSPRIASLMMRDTSVRRLRIVGGRIGTLDLSGSRIAELELVDVRIDYLTLGGARGEDIGMTACAMRSLDMPQAELSRVRFQDCRVDEVDPRGMRASHLDLRGLDAEAYLDVNSLRGATLTAHQVQCLAAVMAEGLGIRVRD